MDTAFGDSLLPLVINLFEPEGGIGRCQGQPVLLAVRLPGDADPDGPRTANGGTLISRSSCPSTVRAGQLFSGGWSTTRFGASVVAA